MSNAMDINSNWCTLNEKDGKSSLRVWGGKEWGSLLMDMINEGSLQVGWQSPVTDFSRVKSTYLDWSQSAFLQYCVCFQDSAICHCCLLCLGNPMWVLCREWSLPSRSWVIPERDGLRCHWLLRFCLLASQISHPYMITSSLMTCDVVGNDWLDWCDRRQIWIYCWCVMGLIWGGKA